jgi:V/A-type H+-transporting ATPase subunit C
MSEAVVTAGNKRVPETDEGYANARLRGMRSHILPGAMYPDLLEAANVTSIIKELSDTTYGPDLEANVVRGRTADVVDDALRDNMVRAYRKVIGFVHPFARTQLSALLGRWDVFNLKTVLRGAHSHVGLDQMKSSFFPAGYLSQDALEAHARFDEVRAVIDTMATWGLPYANPLRDAYPEYSRTGELSILELAVDRQYADWASERLASVESESDIAKRIFGMQIDTANLVTIFRLLKADFDAKKAAAYFLPGGRVIRNDLYMELAQLSDVDEVLDRLKGTPYTAALDSAALRYLETGSISVFERALEEQLMRKALMAGAKDPHGVGVAIAYLYSKQNEITNLRIIVRGKAVGMPPERLKEELILV